MANFQHLDIAQLEPGMVLAEPLSNNVGVALYAADTIITENILKRIEFLSLEGKVLVYDPDSPTPEETPNILDATHPEDMSTPILGKKEQEWINLPQQNISQKALKIYNSVFKTVRNFYQSASLSGDINVKEVKKAAAQVSSEIARDPQVLLQIAVLKAVDNYTYSHAIHVSLYATMLARVLGFPEEDMCQVCLAGLLHDIGKVDIPLEILNKPDRLDADEFKIIKNHVLHSFKRAYNLPDLSKNILAAIGQHHEKIDGSGYMQNLKGSKIHKWARILAIADVYDAVTSKRVYKDALLPHEGAEILMGSIGHLDMDLLKLFLKYISIYPVGCKVVLNTGEIGTVYAANPDLPSRPFVQLDLKRKDNMNILDLSRNLTTLITGVIKE